MRGIGIPSIVFVVATFAALAQAGCGSGVSNIVQHNIGIGSSEVTMGVTLEVRRAPMAPGVRPGTDSSVPLEGAHIRVMRGEELVGELVTDGEGRIGAQLEPGTYTIIPLPTGTSEWPKPPAPVNLVVPSRGKAHALLVYDTGIR